jgi:hypothetical protein
VTANLARLTRTRPLLVCSLCLRVQRGSDWVPAENVIRDLRSYELAKPPRLGSAVCDDCAESILSRRAQISDVPVAA